MPQTGDTPLTERWEQLKDALSHLDVFLVPEANANTDVHTSLVSNFLESSGIHKHIGACLSSVGCTPVQLYDLVNYPDEMDDWIKYVEAWMLTRMNSLKEAHYGLRKEGLKESTEKEAPTVGLSPLQEKQTRSRYARTIAKLLLFTWKTFDTPLAAFWSRRQLRLKTTLASLSRCVGNTLSSQETINQLLDLAMFQYVGFSCSLAKLSRVQSAVEQFIALSMIQEDGSFFAPLELTHNIAAVQYGIRLGLTFHWVALASEMDDDELEEDEEQDLSNDAEMAKMRQHFSWISQDSRASPFMTLRDWMRLGSTFIMNEQVPDETHWVDSEMTRLMIGPSTITINGVQTSLRAVITSLRTEFQNVLKGVTLPDFLATELVDDSRNTSLHYNYLVPSTNEQLYRLKVLKDWTLNGNPQKVLAPNWEEVIQVPNPNLKRLWAPGPAWRWLERTDILLEYIYFMYHVGCGQPARGTEETCMLIRNTESAPRNVYWRGNRMMLQTWYHKGQNITHRSKPRQVYLTGELSMQLHNYLAYIRPVQLVDTAKDMQDYLWVSSRKGRLETNDFTRIMKKFFPLGGNDALGMRSWRQASVAIASAHLNKKIPAQLLPDEDTIRQDLEEDMGLNNVMDLQRNHTSMTSNLLYGGSSGSGVARDGETNFMKASEAWQAFWRPIQPVADEVAPADKARQALTIFTKNPNARFRSEFQHKWLTELFREKLVDLLVVSKTGGGKSLAFTLPPLVFFRERTIVVQPLRALINQTMNDLRRLEGVKAQLYLQDTRLDKQAQVIVALADHAASLDFVNQLRTMQPTRIIIDEAHSFLEDGFRTYIPGVVALGQICCQIVLLTGSLPPSQEQELLSSIFGRTRINALRESTFRPELNIEVHSEFAWPNQLADIAIPMIHNYIVNPEDRAMIFIENRKDVGDVAEQLDCFFHHSGLTDEERDSNAAGWLGKDRGVIVATSGFGAGINYAHVRLVIIYGIPNESEANKVYQQIGRAGRDGNEARIELIPGPIDRPIGNAEDQPGMDDFKKALVNPMNCPAQVFSRLEDEQAMSCKNYPTFRQCLACRRHSRNLGVRGPYELQPRPLPIQPPPIQQDSGSSTTDGQFHTSPRALGIDDVELESVGGSNRNSFGKRLRTPDIMETGTEGMDEVQFRKIARVAEERRIQEPSQIPTFSKQPASVNLVDSTSAVELHAEEDHQASLLKDFIAKMDGALDAKQDKRAHKPILREPVRLYLPPSH
ncbi:hypothetical protein PGT21_026606 [Puccinia graminis f. sp. tritici]|uniref:DNA 3'-5' helicase n=1 Tax=Puccinia graminis f. sp. tritici TaxID=56615 RepID=A0A5B0ML48_PUCGR|nr:hypothetical protein PGT21_026606 [Puccinia graminis f. sp. tritici]